MGEGTLSGSLSRPILPSEEVVERLRSYYENEGSAEFTLKLEAVNTTLSFNFTLNSTYPLRAPQAQLLPEEKLGSEAEEFKELLDTLGSVARRFEVLPSKGTVKLTFTENRVDYYIVTPKIRARNATSPSDTLKALLEAADELRKLSSRLAESEEQAKQAEEFFEKLYSLPVKLEPMEGVKVDRANVTFRELAKVKAELVEETTTTPGASVATTTLQAKAPSTSMELALAGVAALIVAGVLVILLRRR